MPSFLPATAVAEPKVIGGHPEEALLDGGGNLITMMTLCANCGELHTILFLSKDRWYCTRCRMQGATPPNLYPIA